MRGEDRREKEKKRLGTRRGTLKREEASMEAGESEERKRPRPGTNGTGTRGEETETRRHTGEAETENDSRARSATSATRGNQDLEPQLTTSFVHV